MFEHSVKVPQLYKYAAKILQEVVENGCSLKQQVFSAKYRKVRSLLALLSQTIENYSAIDSVIQKSELFKKENRIDPWLARILVYEIIWLGKTITHESKPIKTILAYRDDLTEHKLSLKTNKKTVIEKVKKPRYVRINTLMCTVEAAINGFRDEGWTLVRYNDKDYDRFLSKVAALESSEFMADLHVKELLVFPPNTTFYKHQAYQMGSLVLQDKASCLPVCLLNPPPGSTVLDMCAAPGMKTSYLAACLNNQGTIYAVEQDEKRFQTLTSMAENLGTTCVKTINKDVLTVSEQTCPNVEYILVDPSCSGSGMTERIELDAEKEKPNPARLEKLASFQVTILKHALMHFPKAKRVVYSTCSIYPQENEGVVKEVLKHNIKYKLVSARNMLSGLWKDTSENSDDVSECCISTTFEKDLTNGFFVAVFERDESLNLKNNKENEHRQKEIGYKNKEKEIGNKNEVKEYHNKKQKIGNNSIVSSTNTFVKKQILRPTKKRKKTNKRRKCCSETPQLGVSVTKKNEFNEEDFDESPLEAPVKKSKRHDLGNDQNYEEDSEEGPLEMPVKKSKKKNRVSNAQSYDEEQDQNIQRKGKHKENKFSVNNYEEIQQNETLVKKKKDKNNTIATEENSKVSQYSETSYEEKNSSPTKVSQKMKKKQTFTEQEELVQNEKNSQRDKVMVDEVTADSHLPEYNEECLTRTMKKKKKHKSGKQNVPEDQKISFSDELKKKTKNEMLVYNEDSLTKIKKKKQKFNQDSVIEDQENSMLSSAHEHNKETKNDTLECYEESPTKTTKKKKQKSDEHSVIGDQENTVFASYEHKKKAENDIPEIKIKQIQMQLDFNQSETLGFEEFKSFLNASSSSVNNTSFDEPANETSVRKKHKKISVTKDTE